ncbi:metallophosphoesterase family protein, partial [Verrucomicrobiota bacterium]
MAAYSVVGQDFILACSDTRFSVCGQENMRLALISDIHANAEALGVLADVLSDADRVLCLGDLVGYYCQVNETIEAIRSLDPICVLGNHDHFLLDGCSDDEPPAVRFGIEFAAKTIAPEHRQWLASLPLVWEGVLGGRSVLMTHGSPWHPLTDYLYADNPALNELKDFDFDVITFAQTHRALERTESRPFLLNPGSVGQSRDVRAQACAMILDTDSMAVT